MPRAHAGHESEEDARRAGGVPTRDPRESGGPRSRAGIPCRAYRGGGTPERAWGALAEQGQFTIQGLTPGTYTLELAAPR